MAAQDEAQIVISRQAAKCAGGRHYFTGVACINGHCSVRSVATRQCLACTREAVARMRAPTRRPAPIPTVTEGLVSRREARASGLPHYFTGIPCRRGHLAKRTTKRKQCVECHREHQAEARAQNGDRVKEVKAASYVRHREKALARSHAYIAANRDAVRERRRKFRAANKKRLAEANAVWRAENRHISRQHERNRRAREAGAEGRHTAAEVAELLKKQRYQCAAPGCRLSLRKEFHVDHIQPLSRGGSNWIANIQLLCPRCNQSKHARDPIEWAQSLGRLL